MFKRKGVVQFWKLKILYFYNYNKCLYFQTLIKEIKTVQTDSYQKTVAEYAGNRHYFVALTNYHKDNKNKRKKLKLQRNRFLTVRENSFIFFFNFWKVFLTR